MAWSTPSTRSAGYLVTADNWNEIVNNLKHLRGQDGTTVLEGDVDPDGDNDQAFGSPSKRWSEGHFNQLYASNGKRALHGYVREQIILWDDPPSSQNGITQDETAGGTSLNGGGGQAVRFELG